MSRLDEALRRRGLNPVQPKPEDSQDLFFPAWSVRATSRPEDPGAARGTSEPGGLVEPGGLAQPGGLVQARSGPRGLVSFASAWRNRLAAGPDSDPHLVEQYRRLAATLHHGHQTNGLRSVIGSSAMPGDGKTMTAVNLAIVLAESYRYRVLLVDADLRRPSIPNVMELADGSGLSEVLRASSDKKLALVPLTSRLTLLPAGQPISNSIEALTSPRMRRILEEAYSCFDWVIMDSPPVGPTADARLLAQMVGGTIFVVHAGRTQYPDVQKAIDTLGREQILGVVLNGVSEAESGSSYYYYGTPSQGSSKG